MAEDIQEVIKAAEEAMNAGDLEAYVNFQAEDLTAMVTFRQNLELSLLGGSRERVDLPSEN